MTRRDQSRDADVTGAQRVSRDELQRARVRSDASAARPWASKRKRMGVAQFVAAKNKTKWLARERSKAGQIKLTPEEIEEDKGFKR